MVEKRSALFATIPARDYLLFWRGGRLQLQRVVRFLGLSKSEVARISGVAAASVRFDRKAPRDLHERFTEIAATCTLVAEFFQGDVIKTSLWFKTVNPLLGDISPRDMIALGRHGTLRRFVMDARAENSPASSTPLDATSKTQGNPADRYLDRHREAIAALCERFGVRRLAVFGSVLRSDFDPTRSDVDLAVEFGPQAERSPARQYFDFKRALEELLARPVDLVELSAMPNSRLKRIIERTQVPVYAQAA
jgi:predicted nucleotidyltransferase